MIILGIETSCDETAASVVKDGREILSHVVASSAQMHIETGGIIPEQAAREQVRSIIPVIEKSIKILPAQAGTTSITGIKSIDAIAVTVGPGLIGSLLVGVETARTLAFVWNKPIVPVNHLAAHIYANWLENRETENRKLKFPAVALVVSGGHTDLVLLKGHGEIQWIGGTRDDAAGECFDKTARILGLPYPGGPAIAAAAASFQFPISNFQLKLPRPMIEEENFDFSFSGLKTAVMKEVSSLDFARDKQISRALAYEIQEAITDVLVAKTLRAVKEYKVSTLLLAGGVAANQRLREKFKMEIGKCPPACLPTGKTGRAGKMEIDFRVPPPWLCTDNASYIAAYAYYNYKPVPWQEISANPGLIISEI